MSPSTNVNPTLFFTPSKFHGGLKAYDVAKIVPHQVIFIQISSRVADKRSQGFGQWMNSSIIHDNICPPIHRKCHPKGYHSDMIYNIALNFIFWSERRQITLYHVDFAMHFFTSTIFTFIHLNFQWVDFPFKTSPKTYRERFFLWGCPTSFDWRWRPMGTQNKGKIYFPFLNRLAFPSSLLILSCSLFLSFYISCAFPWGFPCPIVHCAHWNYRTCQDSGYVFYGQSRGINVWNNEIVKENIPFSACCTNSFKHTMFCQISHLMRFGILPIDSKFTLVNVQVTSFFWLIFKGQGAMRGALMATTSTPILSTSSKHTWM